MTKSLLGIAVIIFVLMLSIPVASFMRAAGVPINP